MKLLVLVVCLFSSLVQAEEVSPETTNPEIRTVKGNHVYYLPANPTDKTVITIGGTSSLPSDLKNVHEWALAKGFRVIGLDYENEVISTACWTHEDPGCFDNYRDEISFGRDRSDLVQVDSANSIINRIVALQRYLKWNIDYKKVILIGHSQGAGHVAYIAKFSAFGKVIMTGGPHDFVNGSVAGWVRRHPETNFQKFFTFIHKRDLFGTESPLEVSKVLMGGNPKIETVKDAIEEEEEDVNAAPVQIYVTDRNFPDPHNSYTDPAFKKIWDKFLKL